MRLTTRSSIPKPVAIGIKSTFEKIEKNDTSQKKIPTKALGQEVYLPTKKTLLWIFLKDFEHDSYL